MNAQKMNSLRIQLASLLLALMVIGSGCGKDWLPSPPGACIFDSDCLAGFHCIDSQCVDLELGNPDGGVILLGFGEQCQYNEQCESTYCLPHPAGSFCTQVCDDGCPQGWQCKLVDDPHGGPQPIGLCAVVQNHLCEPCLDNLGCNVVGSDLCLEVDGANHCAIDCTYDSCPEGYGCQSISQDGIVRRQCLPLSGTCSCSASAQGQVRGCSQSNEHGNCSGLQVCQEDAGWSACDAGVPGAEECNGLDDDCDGFFDEELQGGPCSLSNEHGTCSGHDQCRGDAGWVCAAPTPAPEQCNDLDDDCDGTVDEDFLDGQGRLVHDQHCGACDFACDLAIPHSSQTTCSLVEGQPTCLALECQEGWFVYDQGKICLALPQNLCSACGSDADCLAPDSRCMENGTERYCGRDCSVQSPYGTECPTGYECLAYQDALQCQPTNDTCLCRASTAGTVRSCLKDTCTGYQECLFQASQYSWTECTVDAPDICDGEDNNCDGQVDEGYLNPQNGRYESDAHCGFCNNDCSRYWSLDIHHVAGLCDQAAQPIPQCIMGPCAVESEGGQAYEWVDVNGSTEDGCECRRIMGNTDNDPPDLLAVPEPGLDYLDANCDGVDGVMEHALFVRAGISGGDGSREQPLGTIAQGLAMLRTTNKAYVLVAEGRYDEDIFLEAHDALHGGYSADFMGRDVVLHAAVITGQTSFATVQVSANNGSPVLLSGFVIQAQDGQTSGQVDQAGSPSTAVWLADCDEQVILRSNQIVAGRGGDGGQGRSGQAGYGRQDSAQLDGTRGRDGERLPASMSSGCPANSQNQGGVGGLNSVCSQASGRTGGTTVCPVFDWTQSPVRGAQAQFTDDSAGDGLGGYDWSFDNTSFQDCTHATESGYPSDIQLNVGQDGADGQDGDGGQGGLGGTGSFGSIQSGLWTHQPQGAQAGTSGQSGQGGGGGGGGGGTAYYHYTSDDCNRYELGPSGGGGGAGGCAGLGGAPGKPGGASIAIYLSRSTAPVNARPKLLFNVIQRGVGGSGGVGGFGGQGGLGGVGGFGGLAPAWISSAGGKGGDGSNGGPGGGGGGGAGGPSFDLLSFGLDSSAYLSDNLFPIPDGVPTGGAGGAGGGSVGINASGQDGLAGAHGNRFDFQSCPSSGNCPAGQTCDSNQVCVPLP